MPRLKPATLALAAMMSTAAITAYAAVDATPSYQTQTEMLKIADEALGAVTDAHAARLALFDNNLEAAKDKLADARAVFVDAEKELNDFTIGDTEDPSSAAKFLPFNLSMALSEDFQSTPETAEALEKAQGLIQSGSTDDAIDVLRLASIDVDISAAMLPVEGASEQLQKAQDLLDDGKYFEANLALKEMEDSVVVRTYSLDMIPQQGAAE